MEERVFAWMGWEWRGTSHQCNRPDGWVANVTPPVVRPSRGPRGRPIRESGLDGNGHKKKKKKKKCLPRLPGGLAWSGRGNHHGAEEKRREKGSSALSSVSAEGNGMEPGKGIHTMDVPYMGRWGGAWEWMLSCMKQLEIGCI